MREDWKNWGGHRTRSWAQAVASKPVDFADFEATHEASLMPREWGKEPEIPSAPDERKGVCGKAPQAYRDESRGQACRACPFWRICDPSED